MSGIWGKIIGGVGGFALGGPLGALVGAVAGTGKPILLSTGLADLEQISGIKRFVDDTWASLGTSPELALLHCVTSYPTPPAEAGLLAIPYLKEMFATTVGYSDHTLGIRAGGEGGTTPALAAYINAIVDALASFGVRHIEMPATPHRVWRAIQDAKAR